MIFRVFNLSDFQTVLTVFLGRLIEIDISSEFFKGLGHLLYHCSSENHLIPSWISYEHIRNINLVIDATSWKYEDDEQCYLFPADDYLSEFSRLFANSSKLY